MKNPRHRSTLVKIVDVGNLIGYVVRSTHWHLQSSGHRSTHQCFVISGKDSSAY